MNQGHVAASGFVIFRLSIREAAAIASRAMLFFVLVFAFLIFRRFGEADRLFLQIGTLVAVHVFLGLLFREVLKVKVCATGLATAWARRPMKWSEMERVERGRIFMGTHGFSVLSKYRPTIVLADSILQEPNFRKTVLGFAPSDSPIRSIFDSVE